MRNHFSKIALTAGFVLALAFTFGCSGGDDGGDPSSNSGGSSPSGGGASSNSCKDELPPVPLPYCNEEEVVTIGSQVWQKCNLKAVPSTGKHSCYCNKPENCEKYGRLYDWTAAMSACPSGFHLPTDEEWGILVKYTSGAQVAGYKLKATSGWEKWKTLSGGSDEFGFSALPGGLGNPSTDYFGSAGTNGSWWTATGGDNNAAIRAIYHKFDEVNRLVLSKEDYLLSVRCLQDYIGGSSSSVGFADKGNDIANYRTTQIGSQVWMAENLNYDVEGSRCYGEGSYVTGGDHSILSNVEIQANCDKYGRLYDWNTAMTVCPSGWHLPSEAEWDTLTKAVGGWGSNTEDFGFFALSGGQGIPALGLGLGFGGLGGIEGLDGIGGGYLWSSSEYDSGKAYRLSLLGSQENDKRWLFSVRCLKD